MLNKLNLPLFAQADIVVCGGGTAGAFAAKSAADMGQKVLIVEQFGSLGGSATNGLVLPIMHTHMDGNPQCSYISRQVRDALQEIGAADTSGQNFDPLMLKIVLEKLCLEAGVTFLFHTFIAETIVSDGKVEALVVANKDGLGLVKGKFFIDATGDADVCVRAGAAYTKGSPENGKNQAISLRYVVANINMPVFGAFINEVAKKKQNPIGAYYGDGKTVVACTSNPKWAFTDIFNEAIRNGDLTENDKAYWQGFSITGRQDCIAFNNPEFFNETDGTNPQHLTHTQLEGKQTILRQLRFYKKYFKGFENAYISDIAAMVGVRESRNVVTEYVLSAQDILCHRKFDDMFCQSNYPVDIHGKILNFDKDSLLLVEDGKPWYEIPFRSLIVKGFDNLFVAGRCLGAEFLAQSSLRVQHSVRSSGEAAGIGAALACERHMLPREISGQEVRKIMIKKGAAFV